MREGAGLFPPLRFYQQPTMTNRAPVLSLRDPALEHRHPPTARPISSSLDWSVNVFSRHSSVLTCTRIGEAAHDTIQVTRILIFTETETMKIRDSFRSTRLLNVIILLGFLTTSTSKSSPRLDVFHKISDGKSADLNRTLSLQGLQTFVDTVIGHLKCESHGDEGDHDGHDHGDHDGHDHGDHDGHDHGDHDGHDHGDHDDHADGETHEKCDMYMVKDRRSEWTIAATNSSASELQEISMYCVGQGSKVKDRRSEWTIAAPNSSASELQEISMYCVGQESKGWGLGRSTSAPSRQERSSDIDVRLNS
ncbi:hypothetical protein RRG08_060513 [Elysia crispata]|uniref:Uncharacterized protein n=1 Tax=Elysia crispata TaxID=231223 RepID=A0AAE1AZT6_9GAST|nr:hypothetical protein RRG08_060513 [Elysia crispata]